ncbi:MAG: hypothetical protein U0263_16555 [Polyangiaceae bacterium]
MFLARGWNGELTPKVLDFGISKIVEDAAPSELTTDSTFLGSPHYVSPEVARGDRQLDGRADQYSLGVILYEGATGVRPFARKAETFMGLMYAIAQGDFPPPHLHHPGLPLDFERIVLKAMATQKTDRFPNVASLGRALLPFASPRTRTIWEPVFGAMSTPKYEDATVPELQRAPFEETGGTLGRSASALATGVGPNAAVRPLGFAWWALASIAALLVGMGVTWGATRWVAFSKNRDRGALDTEVVEGAGNASSTYSVSVKVDPPEATIELDGRRIGSGAYSATFQADSRKHTLRMSAPGRQTQSLDFDAMSPPPKEVVLAPLAGAPEPPKPDKKLGPKTAPGAKPAPSSGSKSGGLKTDNIDPWDDK